MKKTYSILFICLAGTALLSGCQSSGELKDGAAVTEGPGVSATEIPGVDTETQGLDNNGNFRGRPLDGSSGGEAGGAGGRYGRNGAGGAGGSGRVIYFEYDSDEIKPEYRNLIQETANHINKNPSAEVILEGHTDERGSREYNLALGERRAQAVKRQLGLIGGRGGAIRTTSYGEERPADEGHDEQAYSANRRVEINY